MDEYETLNHTTWDCKYHLVFIPKYRRKVLYQELRKPLGEVFPHPRLGPRYSDSAHPDPCRGDRRSLPKCGASRGGVIACCSQGPGNRRQRRAEHPQIWRKTPSLSDGDQPSARSAPPFFRRPATPFEGSRNGIGGCGRFATKGL
jgi:Transposase IS200 like